LILIYSIHSAKNETDRKAQVHGVKGGAADDFLEAWRESLGHDVKVGDEGNDRQRDRHEDGSDKVAGLKTEPKITQFGYCCPAIHGSRIKNKARDPILSVKSSFLQDLVPKQDVTDGVNWLPLRDALCFSYCEQAHEDEQHGPRAHDERVLDEK
jgi:hypothetical protein